MARLLSTGRVPAPMTSLVGREQEIAAVAALKGNRWTTLVGPGGVGKTRVAIAVANKREAEFGDRLRWVDLAAETSVDGALRAV